MQAQNPAFALPASMRGMEIQPPGSPARLAMRALPLPVPLPHELLIQVHYAGLNRADLLQLEGKYAAPVGASPLPGLEVSGIVAAMGAEVNGWELGAPACALLSGGGYAEYVAAPARHALPVPENINMRDAATLPEAAATSIMALIGEANLQAGERILIHGGTSGLGILMTQIARSFGAEVYATVGSPEKAALLEGMGIHAINHRTAPFHEQLLAMTQNAGVDVIIDTLGGPQLANHFKLLCKGGRLVSLAMLEGNEANIKVSSLLMKHLRWSGTTLRSRSDAEKAAYMETVRTRVWPALGAGHIRPRVDSVFPLAEAEKALARMQERLHMGKILLEVAPQE